MRSREPFDLLARARRQPLTAVEEEELSALLEEDAGARCFLEAGLEADRQTAAHPDDEALITRMARRAELAALQGSSASSTQTRPQRANRVGRELRATPALAAAKARPQHSNRVGRALRATPALAAAICFACGAFAGVGAIAVYSAVTPAPAASARSTTPERDRERAKAPQAAPSRNNVPASPDDDAPALLAAPVPADTVSPALSGSKVRALPSAEGFAPVRPLAQPSLVAPKALAPAVSVSDQSTPAELPPAPSTASVSAAELYQRANRARQEGRTKDALETYRELQASYPVSREAVASHLTMGNLYLLQGNAALALEQFRAHRTAGGGGFEPESLWGEANALRKLGRVDEERAVLSELVSRYPNSAYELPAQRRLRTSD